MNRIAAASGAFNAFVSISCMLIVKRIWTSCMEFAQYKFIIIIIIFCGSYTFFKYRRLVIVRVTLFLNIGSSSGPTAKTWWANIFPVQTEQTRNIYYIVANAFQI